MPMSLFVRADTFWRKTAGHWLVTWVALCCSTQACADLADTVLRVKPSIAVVGLYKATNNPRFAMRGTGFVVDAAQGGQGRLLVTNAHVVQQPVDGDPDARWLVQVRDGTRWQARAAHVLEVDAVHDLALLRLDGGPVAALTVGDSTRVREGDALAFMGFPIGGALGFAPVTHRAGVSAITAAALPMAQANQLSGQAVRSLRDAGGFDIFQLDATAYPGNSGGPLFDVASGEVMGVVSMVLLKSTREAALAHPSGISYAVPSRFVREMLQRHALAQAQ